jgi:hypothetical protein
MSREFGRCQGGYLHSQIEWAAEDLANGHLEVTRQWAGMMRTLYPVMYAICSAEEYDSGVDFAIFRSIEAIPQIREELTRIEAFLHPYERVIEEAVRRHATEAKS